MILVGTLFILTPTLAQTAKIPTFAIAAIQSGYSIYLIYSFYQAFEQPSDPQSLENYYDLFWAAANFVDLIVFLLMTVSFVIALYNPPTTSFYSTL